MLKDTTAEGDAPVGNDGAVHGVTSDPLDASIQFTFFTRKEKPEGRLHATTWRGLFGAFANKPLSGRKKLDLPGFALATFENNVRRAGGVREVFAVALDIDNKGEQPVGIDDVLGALEGTLAFVYTSYSHTPAQPRFRVVIPTSRTMRSEEFARVWTALDARLRARGIEIDQACRDASRLWFWPAKPNDDYTTKLQPGSPLDVDALLVEVPLSTSTSAPTTKKQQASNPGEEQEIVVRRHGGHPTHLFLLTRHCEFVRHVAESPSSVSYIQWFAAATILHSFPHGDDLFHDLSALDLARYDHGEAKKLLASIKGKPVHCAHLGWSCPKLSQCASLGVRSPAGLPFKIGGGA